MQWALVRLFQRNSISTHWVPLPFMRRVPLKMAETLGEHTLKYRWFGAFYILLVFVLIPLLLFVFSFAIALGPGGIILNIMLDMATVGGAIVAVRNFDKLMVLA